MMRIFGPNILHTYYQAAFYE